MADMNKYFSFSLDINGLSGDNYTINGEHSVDGNTTVSSSIYTVGTTTTIYLKHGQSINISDIPEGTTYTITEEGASDYETYIDGSSTDNKASGIKTVSSANTNDNTAFVNNKDEISLTGIILNNTPYIFAVSIAVLGIFIIKKSANKE